MNSKSVLSSEGPNVSAKSLIFISSIVSSKQITPSRGINLGKISKPSSISKLSVEEIHLIFKELEAIGATCFALACKGLYSIYKIIHPEPIPLNTPPLPYCWPAPFQKSLAELLKDFMGSSYEFDPGIGNGRFLNLSVYNTYDPMDPSKRAWGGVEEDNRCALWWRLGDYERCPHLPNPYNRGEDWYRDAIEAIMKDPLRKLKPEEWREKWEHANIFHHMLLNNRLQDGVGHPVVIKHALIFRDEWWTRNWWKVSSMKNQKIKGKGKSKVRRPRRAWIPLIQVI